MDSNPSGAEAFRVDGLSRKFGDFTAVDGVTLSVRAGEFFGFLGPNGAGKTTTLRMVTGMLKPTSGSIRVLGLDPFKSPIETKSRIGIVPDDPPLYDRLTGMETLEFTGRIQGLMPRDARGRAGDLLDLLGIEEAAETAVGEYSMGMKKKLSLGCALIHKPRLLFLDEPFSGIDPIGVKNVKDVLAKLVDDGATVFFSSHVMELVERICTRMAVIDKGRIKGCGTLDELRAATGSDGESTLEEVFVRLVGEQPNQAGAQWLNG